MRTLVAISAAVAALGVGLVWYGHAVEPLPVKVSQRVAAAAQSPVPMPAAFALPRDPSLLVTFAALKQISPLSHSSDEPIRLMTASAWTASREAAGPPMPVRKLAKATPLPSPRPDDMVTVAMAVPPVATAVVPAKAPRAEIFGVKLPRFVPTVGAMTDKATAVRDTVADTAGAVKDSVGAVKDSVLGLLHL